MQELPCMVHRFPPKPPSDAIRGVYAHDLGPFSRGFQGDLVSLKCILRAQKVRAAASRFTLFERIGIAISH